ncbi:ATP-binding protein [Paraliobacillus sp. JSM ZJ581]|uniref:ATP-binding protein n=1 Tax=Paraliobacillus sp. JSM ZJ581 TaxID=3342118 RepID=UPI0035A919F0
MKKSKKTNLFSLLPILFTFGVVYYFVVMVIEFPLIGMEVEKENNHWVVTKVRENSWASTQSIEKGDILEFVDGKKPEQHSTVVFFDRVEKTKTITIRDKNEAVQTLFTSYSYLNAQQVVYSILPFLFILMTIVLSMFLYRNKEKDKLSIILIYFLLSLGISYLSSSGSTRGDIIGTILNTITLPGSLILFIHFIKGYLLLNFNVTFIKNRSIVTIYITYFIILALMIGNLLFYNFNVNFVTIQLLFLLSLIGHLFFHLIQFYFTYKNTEKSNVLKILWVALFLGFSPFISLYTIPKIFFKNELVPAKIASIFLIIIPITFIYLYQAEKLFDIEFLLNKLRYYALLSFPFSIISLLCLCLILNIDLLSGLAMIILFLIFTGTILLLYIKEYLDYKMKHHLLAPKNKFETSLYTFFQKAKHETKVDSLISSLKNEIRNILMVKKVLYIEVVTDVNKKKWSIEHRNNYPMSLVEYVESMRWDNYQAGSLIEMVDGFGIVISENSNNKRIIFFGMKKSKANLNIQEKIWIETLVYFSSILLENFRLIERLVEKIEDYKNELEIESSNYPPWLSRLMFFLSEKERKNLSIDLHDTVLQEQLQILRDFEALNNRVTDTAIKNDICNLREKIIDNIHLIRETCHDLRPPFLNELGIIESIKNLIDQTNLRANFVLKSELDYSIQLFNKEYELMLYRVVQELLNNAVKHSLASEVSLSLQENNQVLTMKYTDNGQGFDREKLKHSFDTMGILGIRERIKSIDGRVDISSALGKGTQVIIKINTGDVGYD